VTCARDLLDSGAPECVGEHQTLHLAARPVRGLEVTAQLICADDDWLLGILTGQDTAVKCVAVGPIRRPRRQVMASSAPDAAACGR
jgi:hypothetical protein